jgi:hypothetical protein
MLLWLSLENSSELVVMILAIVTSFLLTIVIMAKKYQSLPLPFHNFVIAGVLAGAAVTPLALTFIIIKNGLHAHIYPDYSIQQISIIIHRTPIWIVGGFLISIGVGIFSKTLLNP